MSAPAATDPQSTAIAVSRLWTTADVDPFDDVEWERRTATITGEDGETVFEQADVEFPVAWSHLATNVVASKYFRGTLGTPERETSVRQLIGRVVTTVGRWGRDGGYFASEDDAAAFEAELAHLLLHQKLSFNSPVWFNVGVEAARAPQVSACFINSVQDSLESILELCKTEGMLFKYGSGTGTNLSPIRSSREGLSGGGQATGPLSFMRGYDAMAGAIKSGGKTRRAAKMVILNADHPDVGDFIDSKALEEAKAQALIAAGYDGSFGGEAYTSVFYQNANHSVRVTDAFMAAVVDDHDWELRSVSGDVLETVRARELMIRMANAAWSCGDPGLQFDSVINTWHTCANSGRINASNPCSEYMFLDDSACNLASLNLLKFATPEGGFEVADFEHAVDLTILAQEILVDNAGYPTADIEKNSHRYRPLGLGYANLGALLMSCGLPYDSSAGRAMAAAVTALMGGRAYAQSADIAEAKGPFEGHADNAAPMLAVMKMHRAAVDEIDDGAPEDVVKAARAAWEHAVEKGADHGYRNAQATVLAPTGTIAFMMDCDTTGIEPDIALVKYKRLAGGGMMRIVNRTVTPALNNLGYDARETADIVKHIQEQETIEGAPHLKTDDLGVFDCAFRAAAGRRSINPMGHIRMMAAVQPFLSGAISKTVNVPSDTTPDDIQDIYVQAWRLGLKAVAVYRDGCKQSQPLTTGASEPAKATVPAPYRRRLPDERRSITHKFNVGGHKGYIVVGTYTDDTPGEIFIVMAKQGSTIGGLMDSFATSVSLSLQYGVPLDVLVRKFTNTRFEPSGFTTNPEIPMARSIMDYIFRWLALKFPEAADATLPADPEEATTAPTAEARRKTTFVQPSDAPPCQDCGSLMVRNGTCHKCLNCGSTSGCS